MDIVYSADHNYLFYCCVSICSLMDHIPPEQEVRIHLLTGESFSGQEERLLQLLLDKYVNLSIIRHQMKETLFSGRDYEHSLWSKAAFYRLLLPELLPEVKVCLYLDSDTLIVDDVMPLWEFDLSGCYLAGVFEDISAVRPHTVGTKIPGIDTYINSGVLLLNLEQMRRDSLQEKLLGGELDAAAPDQDLLNIVCCGKIRLLPPEYNYILGIHSEQIRIQHFLMRDYIRPWKNLRAFGAGRWWHYAGEFAGVYDIEILRQSADWYQKGSIGYLYRRCADYANIYVVGSGEDANRLFRALRLGRCRGLRGIVRETDSLAYKTDTLLLVTARRRPVFAVREYSEHPDGMRQIVYYEKWPVSYYNNSVSEELDRDLAAELLMWEFGVNARGMTTPGALLELNAVRFPEKEALIVYEEGARHTVSFGELNRRANRLAAWLKQQKVPRGSRVGVCRNAGNLPDCLAAAFGILKGGYVLCPAGEAETLADLGALQDENLSPLTPLSEPMPDEPAFFTGGETLTGRALTQLAEALRRRCGWHGEDRLLLCPDAFQSELTGLLAAFACGTPTLLSACEDAECFLELLMKEKITLASVPAEGFAHIAGGLEKAVKHYGDNQILDCRMVFLDQKPSPACQSALEQWNQSLPHIPVNGMGYAGKFYYDAAWY